MKGTEKQVAWAEDIKRNMVSKFTERMEDTMRRAKGLSADQTAIAEQRKAMAIAALNAKLDGIEDARWYIDNRDMSTDALLKLAMSR